MRHRILRGSPASRCSHSCHILHGGEGLSSMECRAAVAPGSTACRMPTVGSPPAALDRKPRRGSKHARRRPVVRAGRNADHGAASLPAGSLKHNFWTRWLSRSAT